MIDSAAEGCGAVSCAGYAILSVAWQVLDAESVNKLTGFCLQDPSKDGVRLAAKGLPLNAYPGLL